MVSKEIKEDRAEQKIKLAELRERKEIRTAMARERKTTAKKSKRFRKGVEKLGDMIIGKEKTSKQARAHQLKVLKLKHKQRMAYLKAQAEQIAKEQDPRYQHDDDGFLSEVDQIHEMNVVQARQQPQQLQHLQQQNPKGSFIGNFGRGLSRYAQKLTQRKQPQVNRRTLPKEMQAELRKRENILNTPATILNTPNIFNKPTNTIKTNTMSLMSQPAPAKRVNLWRTP